MISSYANRKLGEKTLTEKLSGIKTKMCVIIKFKKGTYANTLVTFLAVLLSKSLWAVTHFKGRKNYQLG